MPDQTRLESEAEDRAELRRELDDSRGEIQRLRELLLTRDAELGEAKGRLTEMENYMRLLSGIVARLQKAAPALTRLAGNTLRRLQGRPRREGG
jgi:chromosome segregation ATPase